LNNCKLLKKKIDDDVCFDIQICSEGNEWICDNPENVKDIPNYAEICLSCEYHDKEDTSDLTRNDIIDIINSIKYYADENHDLYVDHHDEEYYASANLAYYSVLDTIQGQLIMKDRNPAAYNLGEDLAAKYLSCRKIQK
jgi:hypothetical protein